MATSLGQDEDISPADEDVSPATHQSTNEEQMPEPALLELHEMLVDIQINVNNILHENKEMNSEMEGLKSTVSRQTNEISTLKTHLQKMDNQYQEVEKQLDAAKRRVDEQQEEINEFYTTYKINWNSIPVYVKKSKAIWLGKWVKNKINPLDLKWMRSTMRILGVYVSEFMFRLKIGKTMN